jgi:protein-L-isoaspartate O-methyltransferase
MLQHPVYGICLKFRLGLRASLLPPRFKLGVPRMYPHRLLIATLLYSVFAFGQKPEYDFYTEFRNSFTPKLRAENPSVTNEEIVKKYAARLKSEGVTETEIAHRTRLIRTERSLLEADYWNRFYTDSNANFNRAPNGFLVQIVEGRRPGAALDYGMGEGRNAIYLASLGWQVWGFDPADAGVALAQKRAKELGLTLHTAAVHDSEYEFGKERFDLVLFSWTLPLVPVQKVVDSLKPGGIVVMECGADFVGSNGMLHMFDTLQIVHYEIVRAKSDFYDRRETDVVRLVARKP